MQHYTYQGHSEESRAALLTPATAEEIQSVSNDLENIHPTEHPDQSDQHLLSAPAVVDCGDLTP